MNREVVKCGLFLLGGIAIGAIGATVVSRGKLKGIKPIASDLLSRGYDVREKVLEKVDAAREDISDVLAEAQAKSEERRSDKEPVLQEAAPAQPAAEKAAAA
mgnify:FL=1